LKGKTIIILYRLISRIWG